MLAAKLVCVFTGYDNQMTLDGVSMPVEEQKQMLSTIVSDDADDDATTDMHTCHESQDDRLSIDGTSNNYYITVALWQARSLINFPPEA